MFARSFIVFCSLLIHIMNFILSSMFLLSVLSFILIASLRMNIFCIAISSLISSEIIIKIDKYSSERKFFMLNRCSFSFAFSLHIQFAAFFILAAFSVNLKFCHATTIITSSSHSSSFIFFMFFIFIILTLTSLMMLTFIIFIR